jgi:hypothetical protein
MEDSALSHTGPRQVTRRRLIVPLLLVSISTLFVGTAQGQEQDLRLLREEYVALSRMLDADISNYLDARRREQDALRRLLELNSQLDKAMTDLTVPSSELVKLDQEIARVRETAFSISLDTADRRKEMGEGMTRLQQIAEEFRRGGVQHIEPNGQVGGTWLVESNDGLGLLSLDQRATRVTGLFRLSNGRHGSARGSFTGDRLKVELEESDFGPIGSLDGLLDASGELEGQWSARELAVGRPTGGTWSARRITFDQLLTLEP